MTVTARSPNDFCPESGLQELIARIRERHRGLVKELKIVRVGERVVLYGTAISFYGKQMAQEEVIRFGPWPVLENRIEVDR